MIIKNNMFITKNLKFWLWIYVCVGIIFPCVATSSPVKHDYVSFLPISISLGCVESTLLINRLSAPRSIGAVPGVNAIECLDKKNSVFNIIPLKVEVVYQRFIKEWMVVLILNDKDASKVNALSANNIGRKIILGVDGKVLVTSTLYAPILGRKFTISTDSEKAGDDMMQIFISSSEK